MASGAAAACCWGASCDPVGINGAPELLDCACGKRYHSHCAAKGVAAFFAGNNDLCNLETYTCGQCGAHAAAAALQAEPAPAPPDEAAAPEPPPVLAPPAARSCACPAAGAPPFVPQLGDGQGSRARAAALIACVDGKRGSGAACCDVPGCARKACSVAALALCECCRYVALCGMCAEEIFRRNAPHLAGINGARVECAPPRAPLCGACLAHQFLDTQCYNDANAARKLALDGEREAALSIYNVCCTRRDEIVAETYARECASQGATTPAADGAAQQQAPQGLGGSLADPLAMHDQAGAPPPALHGAALRRGELVFLPNRSPPAVAVVLVAEATSARVGLMPAADRFTPESDTMSTEMHALEDIKSLGELRMDGAIKGVVTLFGHRGYHAFGVDGYPAGIHRPGDPVFRWGVRCALHDGFGLTNVPVDTQFTFSGAVKTTNSAWSVVLLDERAAEPVIVVVPLRAVGLLNNVEPLVPLVHMAFLQRVRTHDVRVSRVCALTRAARLVC